MKKPSLLNSAWILPLIAVLAVIVAWFTGADLTFLWSPKDYWYALVSAVVGAFIGIQWTIHQFAREHRTYLRSCVTHLRDCLQFNLDRLNQAKDMLEKRRMVPNYPLDTAQLNHWLIQSHDLLDPKLLRELDWQRYQLDHISAKFVVVSQLIASIGTRAATEAEREYMGALQGDLLGHVNGVIEALPPLIERLPK